MPKLQKSSATDSSSLELEKALFDIVSGLSTVNRAKLRRKIEALHKHIGGTQDMFVDRRKLTWGVDGVARKTIEKKSKKLDVQVFWRNADTSAFATMEEAAKIVKKTKPTLAALLSRHNGTWNYLDENDDIVTIVKLSTPLKARLNPTSPTEQ